MKTLVIHPKDITTDFLSVIYADKDYTIIRDNISNSKLRKLIKAHDRIIMLGHGTDYGLIGHGRLIIDSKLVYLLRDKPDSIYIWCNADKFVKKYDLKGFATGMIISEIDEALMFCVNFRSVSDIDDSNLLFADTIKKAIDLPTGDILACARSNYFSSDNNVIIFNQENLFYY